MNSIIKNERLYFSAYDSVEGNYSGSFYVQKHDSGFMMILCHLIIYKIETTFTIPFPIPFASDALCVINQMADDFGCVFCGSGGTDSFTVVWRDRWGDHLEDEVKEANILAIGRWQ